MENPTVIQETREDLKQFLGERDMTLAVAALIIKCSIGTLSKFINAKTNPNSRTMYKIRKMLGKVS